MARDAASAMQVFDTWVAASDRKDDHLLVADDGESGHLRLAYIDYAFAATYDWAHGLQTPGIAKPAWPQTVGTNPEVTARAVELIRAITDDQIVEIINRIPTSCMFDGARDALVSGLTSRRDAINGFFQI